MLSLLQISIVLPKKAGRKQGVRRPWTKPETQSLWEGLHSYIKSEQIPGKAACEACIEQYKPRLDSRSWRDVKFKVKTIIVAIKSDKKQEIKV